jgi:hypothetical protein
MKNSLLENVFFVNNQLDFIVKSFTLKKKESFDIVDEYRQSEDYL